MLHLRLSKQIPKPAVNRLCRVYSILKELEERGESSISSKELGSRIGVGSHNIRKDISYIGETGTAGSGYEIKKLKGNIEDTLGLSIERKACVVGLTNLGLSIINNDKLLTGNFRIVAGFDSNINKLETINAGIPLYPSYDIQSIVARDEIELAVITTPGHEAERHLVRLVEGGIKGIVNLSPVVLSPPRKDIYISNIDLMGEFQFLSALFTINQMNAEV